MQLSKPMFKNPDSQLKFFTALFSFIFTILDNKAVFTKRMTELAVSHCKRGIKACEYGIVGEVNRGKMEGQWRESGGTH